MTTTAATERIWELLEEITDPEIPVLTIIDMGIVRDVQLDDDKVTVTITPTYSGCPAMDMIALNIRLHLIANGLKNIEVISVLSPAWTTDWMTESGKKKLQAYGITPPQQQTKYGSERLNKLLFETDQHVVCPRCHSTHTQVLSQFGSTACKALYQCNECKEPFDYFKCH